MQVQPQGGSAIAYTYTRGGELRTKTQNGQTVTTTYDVLGNLTEVGLPDDITVEYVLDGRSRRIAKKVNGEIVKGWIYSTGSLPIAETDATGVITTRFVYGLRRVPEYFVRDGSKYRIYTEPNGSVRFVVQATTGGIAQQINYDSYGNVTFDSNPGFQPFGYGGGLYDPQTGLVRFGARDYDPYVGRWTAKDPIGFAGGETGFYTYVGNDPVNGVDPSGLGSDCLEHYSADGVPLGLNVALNSVVSTPTIGACTLTLGARLDRALERISGNSSSAKLSPGSSFTAGDFRNFIGLNLILEGLGASLGSTSAVDPVPIATPHGMARQAGSVEAMQALSNVRGGATVYRQGSFGVQNTADAQFWSLSNPATTSSYSSSMGMPTSGGPDWIMGAIARDGATFVTRPAPGLGANLGGGMEAVFVPGGVRVQWFVIPD